MPKPTEDVFDDQLVLTCQVQNCLQVARYDTGFEGPTGFEMARQHFDRHLAQHAPGRTPDVLLSVTYSWRCSACGKHITIEDADPDVDERLWCWNCGASWDTYGTNGRTDLPDPNDE